MNGISALIIKETPQSSWPLLPREETAAIYEPESCSHQTLSQPTP